MAFIPAVLAILSQAGVGGAALATASTIASALSGALGVASGIATKDPEKIVGGAISAASGITGGAGGGGLGSTPTSAPVTASAPVAQAASAAQPLSNADAISKAMSMPGGGGPALQIPSISTPGAQAFVQAPMKGMSMGEKLGYGLQGASTAASGILGLLQAFKGDDQSSSGPHLGFGALDTSLKSAGGVATGALPNIPSITVPGIGSVPTLDLQDPQGNDLILKLLHAYQA